MTKTFGVGLAKDSSYIPPKCVASYSFHKVEEDDLELKRGDVVELLECGRDGWWTGRSNGAVGSFPSNFLNRAAISYGKFTNLPEDHQLQPKVQHAQKLLKKTAVAPKEGFVQMLDDKKNNWTMTYFYLVGKKLFWQGKSAFGKNELDNVSSVEIAAVPNEGIWKKKIKTLEIPLQIPTSGPKKNNKAKNSSLTIQWDPLWQTALSDAFVEPMIHTSNMLRSVAWSPLPSPHNVDDTAPPIHEGRDEEKAAQGPILRLSARYRARGSDELDIEVGDTVQILNEMDQSGWFRVMKNGQTGLIPLTNLLEKRRSKGVEPKKEDVAVIDVVEQKIVQDDVQREMETELPQDTPDAVQSEVPPAVMEVDRNEVLQEMRKETPKEDIETIRKLVDVVNATQESVAFALHGMREDMESFRQATLNSTLSSPTAQNNNLEDVVQVLRQEMEMMRQSLSSQNSSPHMGSTQLAESPSEAPLAPLAQESPSVQPLSVAKHKNGNGNSNPQSENWREHKIAFLENMIEQRESELAERKDAHEKCLRWEQEIAALHQNEKTRQLAENKLRNEQVAATRENASLAVEVAELRRREGKERTLRVALEKANEELQLHWQASAMHHESLSQESHAQVVKAMRNLQHENIAWSDELAQAKQRAQELESQLSANLVHTRLLEQEASSVHPLRLQVDTQATVLHEKQRRIEELEEQVRSLTGTIRHMQDTMSLSRGSVERIKSDLGDAHLRIALMETKTAEPPRRTPPSPFAVPYGYRRELGTYHDVSPRKPFH